MLLLGAEEVVVGGTFLEFHHDMTFSLLPPTALPKK
jgi:hypothetical protein